MRSKNFSTTQARRLLPKRSRHHNKTHGGRALIIAGSSGMYGAAILAATACARMGAGYTQVLTDLKKYSFTKHPDFLTAQLGRTKISKLKFNAVAIGPGLGASLKTGKLLKELLKLKVKNVVVDADVLTVLSRSKMKSLPSTWVLTPHAGELARLLDVRAEKIQKDPRGWCIKAQKKWGSAILLKGPDTWVCDGHRLMKISSGNASLAKSGTGDVLTGLIVGLMAQGLQAFEASCLAAHIHGLVSQAWVRGGRDHLSLLASDISDFLPQILYKLRHSKNAQR